MRSAFAFFSLRPLPTILAGLLFFLPAAAGGAQAQSAAFVPGDASRESSAGPAMSLRPWAPPDIDEAVPPVRSDVACPLPEVLSGAGRRLRELVQNLRQFTAEERIEHMNVDRRGHSHPAGSATFHYIAEIHASTKDGRVIEEYRDGSASRSYQDGLATAGTAVLALILHPSMVDDYSVTCEGLGELRGQPAWLLRFVQRPDRPASFRTYETPKGAFPVALKGRAWIAPDTYQVLRMESELVKPVPELQLREDHVIVDYGPVGFPQHSLQLWLPQTADIYLDLMGERLHRRHSFSHFELYWVEVSHTEQPQNH